MFYFSAPTKLVNGNHSSAFSKIFKNSLNILSNTMGNLF